MPLTLQSAGRALWDPKDCEATETGNTDMKQEKAVEEGLIAIHKGKIKNKWAKGFFKYNTFRGQIRIRKGGEEERLRQNTRLFHLNIICGLKTESFAALGASGQICPLCNAPFSLTKTLSLKHKSFSGKEL